MGSKFKKRYFRYGELPSFNAGGQRTGGIIIFWDRNEKKFVMAHRRYRRVNLTGPFQIGSLLAIITVALVPQVSTNHLQWGLHWYWFVVAAAFGIYMYVSHDLHPQDVTPITIDERVVNSYKYNIWRVNQSIALVGALVLLTWITQNLWFITLLTYLLVMAGTQFFVYAVTSLIIHTRLIKRDKGN